MFPLVARAGVLAEVDAVLTAARAGIGHGPDFEVIWTWCPAAAGRAPLRPWSRVLRLLAALR